MFKVRCLTMFHTLVLNRVYLASDLLELVETHGTGSESTSEAFRRALLDDSIKTTSLIEGFLQLLEGSGARLDYQELLINCERSTATVNTYSLLAPWFYN